MLKYKRIICYLILILTTTTGYGQKPGSESILGKWELNTIMDNDSTEVDVTKTSWEKEEIYLYLTFTKDRIIASDGSLKVIGNWKLTKNSLTLILQNKRKVSFRIIAITQKELIFEWPVNSDYKLIVYYKRQ